MQNLTEIHSKCKCGSDLVDNPELTELIDYLFQLTNVSLGPRMGIIIEFSRFDNKKVNVIEKMFLAGVAESGEISIGRDKSNQIEIDELSVSRFHARIIISGGKIEVFDLGSTFGTMAKMDCEPIGVQSDKIVCFGQKIIKFKVGVT